MCLAGLFLLLSVVFCGDIVMGVVRLLVFFFVLVCWIVLRCVCFLMCSFSCSGRGCLFVCVSMCLRLLLFVVAVLSCFVLSCVYVLCLLFIVCLMCLLFCWFVLRVLGVVCDCF